MTTCATSSSGGGSNNSNNGTGTTGKQKRQLFPEKLWDLVTNQPASGIFWSKNGKRIEIDRAQLEKFLQTSFLDKFRVHSGNNNNNSGSNNSSQTTGDGSSSNSSQLASTRHHHQHHINTVKFRSHNFDSFIRQLHFYGFKKSGNSYHHEKFQRDRPEALYTMKRKYSSLPLGGTAQVAALASGTATDGAILESPRRKPVASSQRQTIGARIRTPKKRHGYVSDYQSDADEMDSSSPPPPAVPPQMRPLPLEEPQPQPQARPTSFGTDIKMYTIDSTGDDDFSFTNVREASVKAIRDGKSMKISIPEFVMNQQDDSWPKTLVLENQNILSAYFIYKLN